MRKFFPMQEATRTAYHASLKSLAKHNLLPDQYRQKINRSLICKWKQEPDEKYMGHEINAIAENQMQLHQQFAHDLPAQKMFEAYREGHGHMEDRCENSGVSLQVFEKIESPGSGCYSKSSTGYWQRKGT